MPWQPRVGPGRGFGPGSPCCAARKTRFCGHVLLTVGHISPISRHHKLSRRKGRTCDESPRDIALGRAASSRRAWRQRWREGGGRCRAFLLPGALRSPADLLLGGRTSDLVSTSIRRRRRPEHGCRLQLLCLDRSRWCLTGMPPRLSILLDPVSAPRSASTEFGGAVRYCPGVAEYEGRFLHP